MNLKGETVEKNCKGSNLLYIGYPWSNAHVYDWFFLTNNIIIFPILLYFLINLHVLFDFFLTVFVSFYGKG